MSYYARKIATALVISLSGQTAMAQPPQASCAIQNQIVTLLAQSEHFLQYLETGRYVDAAADLQSQLAATSLVSLRRQLEESGFANAADPTERLVLQQRNLLRAYRVEGRAPAAYAAQEMNAAVTLREIRNHAATWPCYHSSRVFNGLSLDLSGRTVGHVPASTAVKTGLFGLITLLGSVASGYFWWRSKIDQRRSRRFPCWIPCTISGQSGSHHSGPRVAAIINISRTGARLWCDDGLSAGSKIVLRFANANVEAKVIKVTKQHSSVHFTNQLSSAFVQYSLETYG